MLLRSDRFVPTLTEKLLTYALGRGLEYYDTPAVRAIVREAATERLSRSRRLIVGIVQSAPFQMRMTEQASAHADSGVELSPAPEAQRCKVAMFITKMSLPRRTFLRGMGAALALPLLDAMVPALSRWRRPRRSPVRRLGFVYLPNGVARISPASTTGSRSARARTSSCRRSSRRSRRFAIRLIVVSGLTQHQADALDDGANGDHTRGTSSWLTGVHRSAPKAPTCRTGSRRIRSRRGSSARTPRCRRSSSAIDLNFLAGNCENGYSCVYMNTLSWRSPTTPMPTENNPRIVFERLFGDGGTSAQRLAQARENAEHSRLGERRAARLQRHAGCGDRTKVNDYVDSVREVERRIQTRREARRHGRAADAGTADGHPGAVRRARRVDVRPAVAGVPRRHHPRRHVHARAAS